MSDVKTEMESAVAELVVEPELVKLTKQERNLKKVDDRIASVEDDILEQATSVIANALHFADIHPGVALDAPEEAKLAVELHNEELIALWTTKMGSRSEALKRFRLAQAAWGTAGQMPGGIKLAQETFVGITKARSKDVTVQIGELKAIVMLPQSATATKLLEGTGDE